MNTIRYGMRMDAGYSIIDHIFTRAEMAQAVTALSTAELERTKAGARHVLNVPIVHDLSHDLRLIEIAKRFVGPAAVPFRATLFDKSPDANWLVVWHQDTALPLRERTEQQGWGPWSTKAGVLYAHAPAWALEKVVAVRISLDDSSETNGPLRVLPDTHRNGVLSDARVQQLSREIRAVDCVAAAGSVVAMRPLTIHASSKSTDGRPRRILHIEYAARMELGSGIMLAAA
jgi:ectoine hydroxylase-related dioxygenase (phytanoyl-CoA dioxygenase family)